MGVLSACLLLPCNTCMCMPAPARTVPTKGSLPRALYVQPVATKAHDLHFSVRHDSTFRHIGSSQTLHLQLEPVTRSEPHKNVPGHSIQGCGRTIRRAHSQPAAVEGAAAAVAVLGGLVHNLVVRGVDVVRKLNLCNSCAAQRRCADAEAYNALSVQQQGLQRLVLALVTTAKLSVACCKRWRKVQGWGGACSDSGVLKHRAAPKRSFKPTVHRNTPPKLTSSPNTSALSY